MKRVLCLLTDGFEEIEAITPIDLLRRANIEVVIAGLNSIEITGRSNITLIADALLDEVLRYEFDALLLPGGPGVAALRTDARVMQLVRNFADAEKIIAAICAAPLVLHDAGLLIGKRFTAHSSTSTELPQSTAEKTELDQSLLTSRGAGTALDFGLALTELLVGKDLTNEISTAIMA